MVRSGRQNSRFDIWGTGTGQATVKTRNLVGRDLFARLAKSATTDKKERLFGSGLDFRQIGDKLVDGTDFRPYRSPVLSSLYRLFQQKEHVNPPSFPLLLLLTDRNTSTGSIVSSCLLGVSLSFCEQVLGGTYMFAHGEASGFFVPGCHVANLTSATAN